MTPKLDKGLGVHSVGPLLVRGGARSVTRLMPAASSFATWSRRIHATKLKWSSLSRLLVQASFHVQISQCLHLRGYSLASSHLVESRIAGKVQERSF